MPDQKIDTQELPTNDYLVTNSDDPILTSDSSSPQTQVKPGAADAARKKGKITLIVFSGDLDKVLASFILATSAATMGKDVTMFFTFWGLNAIKKDIGPAGGKGLMRKMLNKLNRGGAKRLALSQFHMFGMGTSMMKKLMKESKVPSIHEFIAMAHEMGVKMVACSTSIGVMGLSMEDFIPEIDSMCGAVAYLKEASESEVNLFI